MRIDIIITRGTASDPAGAVGAPSPAGWIVELRQGATQLARHAMRALDGGYPAPREGGLDSKQLAGVLDGLRRDTARAPDVHALGDHLFAALFGDSWLVLESHLTGSTIVELALVMDDPVLSGLPWELMRSGDAFLAAGLRVGQTLVDVAITRRVARARASYPDLAQPLRYMFVLGTELNDAVRAGAESQGLLRQIAPAVRDYFVQRRSPEKLAREVADFDPHVVHIICHGRDSGAAGVELEMWNDDTNAPSFVGAGDLVDRLVRVRDTERLAPTVVILSACATGDRLDAGSSSGMAKQLVARGVPIVVAMSAEIRDLACRLFTRRLGAAVVDRSPLLAAAIAGRRAALRSPELPEESFDWGMIQIFIGDDVESGLAVKPCAEGSDEAKLLRWLGFAGLPIDLDPARRTYPPLCGATDVLTEFSELMKSKTKAALVIYAQPPQANLRVGKRRAFAEVAALAIRSGHIPVIVMPVKKKGYPATPFDLVKQLRDAFERTRARYELADAALKLAELRDPVEPQSVRRAIEADALALAADARAAHDFIRRAGGEVVIMLHDVHKYAEAAGLALELLGVTGAGHGQRVRVVMSWKQLKEDDPSWRGPLEEELMEQLQHGMGWISRVNLLPLQGTQAWLAYQRVLLHPFRTAPEFAARPWFLDLKNRNDPTTVAALRNLANATRNGCPGHFDDDNFDQWLDEAIQSNRLRAAKDDDLLRGGPGT